MPLNINDIVSVNVDNSPLAVAGRTFNVGLIIGATKSVTSGELYSYANLTEVATDTEHSYGAETPEYKAAELYFAQASAPKKLFIYAKGSDETDAQALVNARSLNNDWYGVTFAYSGEAALDLEGVKAVAGAVEALEPESVLFNFVDSNTAAGSDPFYLAVMKALAALKYQRTITIYSSSGAHAGAALMGYAMGKNYEGSPAFTLAYKPLVGITPETELTSGELTAIIAAHGNVYLNQGSYSLLRQGKMANGYAYDDVLAVDMMANKMQTEVMNALTSENKVPQTDEGTQIIITALTEPLEEMLARGYIATGIWNRAAVKSLATGDILTRGYKVMADKMDEQSQTDRDARKSPNIYICVKMAGAIEYVVLNLTVNR